MSQTQRSYDQPGIFDTPRGGKEIDKAPYAPLPQNATAQDIRNTIGLLQLRIYELEVKMVNLDANFNHKLGEVIDTINEIVDSEDQIGPDKQSGTIEVHAEPNTDIAEESPVEIGEEYDGEVPEGDELS